MATALERIYQRTWTENILHSVLVELTYKCNLDCFFCYNDLGLRGRPLARRQYFELFEDLARMQVMNLTLTGGEPLAHADFFALGAKARALGFVVKIKSNGHALRGPLARRLREEVDPFVVEVSLHGADAETHDRQTRVPGSFDRLLGNLGELRALGQRVKLNCTLTRWNEFQIREMFELADGLGLQLAFFPQVTPRDDGDRSPLEVAPSAAGLRNLFEELQTRSVQPPESEGCSSTPAVEKNCGAGSSGIAVDPFGEVYPCIQWRRSLGNLHQSSVEEIWRRSPALAEVRAINLEAGRKLAHHRRSGVPLGHCMGLSQQNTGDPLEIDPQALDNAEILQEVQAGREREMAPDLLPVVY